MGSVARKGAGAFRDEVVGLLLLVNSPTSALPLQGKIDAPGLRNPS